MKSRGRDLLRRTGVVLAGALLVGSMTSGAAFAQDTDDTTTSGGGTDVVTQVTDTLTDVATTQAGTTSTTNPVTDAVTQLTDALTEGGGVLTETVTQLTDTLTDIATTNATTSTTPTGPSGSNTVVIYSPYPVPVFGDYGKRYYGKYWDHGCGCDRYAAPTYVPQVVNATQVSSVPKGGVDTGDGSFQ